MHWIKYIEIAKGASAAAFPVEMPDVLGWSLTFRCLGTFSNYLSHLRGACCALGHEPPPIGHPAVKRAMGAIAKKQLFSPRPKLAIQRTMLRNMMTADGEVSHGALWLLAYTWLLRLPSEARICACPSLRLTRALSLPTGTTDMHLWLGAATLQSPIGDLVRRATGLRVA